MAYIAADWSADKDTKIIDYIGDAHGGASPTYATTIEAHRAWQALADDGTSTGDDEIAIIYDNPSDRRGVDQIIAMQNGWNITQTASEHIFDGSIIQNGGDDIWDGFQNFGNTSKILMLQDGALIVNDFWNTFAPSGFNPTTGVSHRFMVKVRTAGVDIDGRRFVALSRNPNKTYAEFLVFGTARGNNTLALSESDDLNNQTTFGTIATWNDIVNDTEGYAQIDGNGDGADENYYSDWELGSRSKNDFYERIKWATADGTAQTFYGLDGDIFRGATHELTIDTPTGTFQEPEAISWPGGTGQLLAIDSTTAGTKIWMQILTGVPPVDNELITGGTSAATALLNVTVVDRTATPAPSSVIGNSTGSAIIGAYGVGIGADDLAKDDRIFDLTNSQIVPPNNVTGTVTGLVSGEDRLSVTPLGYRFNYDNEAVANFTIGETLTFTSPAGTAELLELLDRGTTGEITIGEPLSGSLPTDNSTITGGTSTATADVNGSLTPAPMKKLMTIATALTADNVTAIVVNDIPSDTPATSLAKTKLRVVDNDGFDRELEYSSYDAGTDTFTITTTDGNEDFATVNADVGNYVYIEYLGLLATASEESFTSVFNANRNLYGRVRDGAGTPIKEFSTTATLTESGASITVNRQSDE